MNRPIKAFLAGLAICMAGPAAAKASAAAAERINIAGFQRTLILQIATGACYAHAGHDTEAQIAAIDERSATFRKRAKGLRYGDRDLGLAAETNRPVEQALGEVNTLWAGYETAAAAAVEAGAVSAAALAEIAGRDGALFGAMNTAVGVIERTYGAKGLPLHRAVAINIAGRQRSLAVRMARNACMIAAGHEVEAAREALLADIGLFEASLTALRQGMPAVGIRPPGNPVLIAKLDEVAESWAAKRPLLESIAAAETVDAAMLAKIDAMQTELLRLSDEAVGLFEGAGET